MVSLRFLVSGLKSSWVGVGMDGFGKLRGCLCFWLFFMVSDSPSLLTRCLLGRLCPF
jgi:hypothetical protein